MDWNYWDSNLIDVGLMKMKVLFAHGFEGAPNGGKPTYMREELGWDVVAPVMSANGWNIERNPCVVGTSGFREIRPCCRFVHGWIGRSQCQPIATGNGIWIVAHRTGISVWKKCGMTVFL